jgi:hypothetical protein
MNIIARVALTNIITTMTTKVMSIIITSTL